MRVLISLILLAVSLSIKAQCVYLIEQPQFNEEGKTEICLKIGYASSWEDRSKGYRSYIPNFKLLYLTPDNKNRDLENTLHRKFNNLRLKVNSGAKNTEWFHYSEDIINYIKSLPKYEGK